MGEPRLVRNLRELVPVILKASDLTSRSREAIRISYTGGEGRVILVAFGKGALSMARGVLDFVKNIDGGVVVVPEGTGSPLPGVEVIESTHPIPSDKSVRAAEAIIEWVSSADSRDSVLALVSGGGSALVEKPAQGVDLEDVIALNKLLLNSGMSILEINTIRKHISEIKGGRLAEKAYPANTIGLYASDVPGDKLDLIASGPTVPDPSTFEDAIHILKTWRIWNETPESIRKHLEKGERGEIPETPKPDSEIFNKVNNKLIAANIDVLNEISKHLTRKGYDTLILTSRIMGESREVARALAGISLEILERGVPIKPPAALILGGETSVKVRGNGRGGRNMELAIAWTIAVDYWLRNTIKEATMGIIALDTDGIDGITDAAGAIGYNGLSIKAREKGLDPEYYLENNNTYELAEKLGVLIKTGPTGSNLNSVAVILIEKPS